MLVPLGIHILSRGKESDGHVDFDSSAILRNIVLRLTCDTVACLKYWDCWKFVQIAIMDWKTVLQDRVGRTCPAIIMMQQVSLKGSGHVGMSWDSSFSVVTGLQAGRLKNHGLTVGATVSVVATMWYPVCCTVGTAAGS